jgi:hypothetical protein
MHMVFPRVAAVGFEVPWRQVQTTAPPINACSGWMDGWSTVQGH